MSEHPIQGLMSTAMSNIKEMVDVNTIIGEPIIAADGTTIIPVSKVSFGFGTGGSDWPPKSPAEAAGEKAFGGGSGAGISINPIAFLVINNGCVKLLQINSNTSAVDSIISLVPEMVDKVSGMVKKEKKSPVEE
ncbi:GerW family sporulation protein [Feifania hominis]|uniref:GerW family sporulation protein n=1 Tax=Feifania hominis TaxID=2763660 RepID=A0A926HT55_9FIRM|nr:GerW family sporulation protein [Feifania hominis]MBC8535519.1 GerW family sporulation protein [Feifania hominis]